MGVSHPTFLGAPGVALRSGNRRRFLARGERSGAGLHPAAAPSGRRRSAVCARRAPSRGSGSVRFPSTSSWTEICLSGRTLRAFSPLLPPGFGTRCPLFRYFVPPYPGRAALRRAPCCEGQCFPRAAHRIQLPAADGSGSRTHLVPKIMTLASNRGTALGIFSNQCNTRFCPSSVSSPLTSLWP